MAKLREERGAVAMRRFGDGGVAWDDVIGSVLQPPGAWLGGGRADDKESHAAAGAFFDIRDESVGRHSALADPPAGEMTADGDAVAKGHAVDRQRAEDVREMRMDGFMMTIAYRACKSN